MRGILLIAAASVLGGCLSAPDDVDVGNPSGGDVASLLPADLFATVEVGVGGDAETSLTIADDGVMLACSHGGFQIPSPLWSSLDGGVTWKREDPQPNPVPSGDCDVAITDDGSWYMLYDTIYSATVAASRDQGASWSIVFTAAAPLGGVDRPWLEADGSDVVLVWANVIATEPAVHAYARSTDGGRTWTDTRLLGTFDDPARPQKVLGHPLQFPDSRTWRIPVWEFNADLPGKTLIEFWASEDDGATWRTEPGTGLMDFAFHLPTVARDDTGVLYLPISLQNGSLVDVNYVTSADGGATWSDLVPVLRGREMSSLSGVWVDAFGDYATLAWLDHRETEPKGWFVAGARVRGNEVVWAGNLSEPIEAEGRVYEFIMVRHDAAGRAHIVYPMPDQDCRGGPGVVERSRECIRLLSEREPLA